MIEAFSPITIIIIAAIILHVLKKKSYEKKQLEKHNAKKAKKTANKSAGKTAGKSANRPLKDYVFESYPSAENGSKKCCAEDSEGNDGKKRYAGDREGHGGNMSLHDDLTGDWLAEQMREERRSMYKMSEMFGLKAEHAANCDAAMLKSEHHTGCDAKGIDRAKVR